MMQVKKQVVFSDGDLHLWRMLLKVGGVSDPENYQLGESPDWFNFSGTFKGILMTHKVIDDFKRIQININSPTPMYTSSNYEGMAYSPPQQLSMDEEEVEEEEEDIDPEDCGFAS